MGKNKNFIFVLFRGFLELISWYLRRLSMNFFLIYIFRLVLVHKNRNQNQKSWKLILRTFILQASCVLPYLTRRRPAAVHHGRCRHRAGPRIHQVGRREWAAPTKSLWGRGEVMLVRGHVVAEAHLTQLVLCQGYQWMSDAIHKWCTLYTGWTIISRTMFG